MNGFKKYTSLFLIFVMMTGCAASRTAIINDSTDLSDTQICRNYLNDYSELQSKASLTHEEKQYLDALNALVLERDLEESDCEELVSDQNSTAVAIGLLVVVAAALANSGGGGNYYPSQSGYAWDQFYDSNQNLVWRCRNKANGRFADSSSCASAYKLDTTWPAK